MIQRLKANKKNAVRRNKLILLLACCAILRNDMRYSSSIATQLWSIQAVHSIRASEIKNRRQAE